MIAGITKVRNEEHIIETTITKWAQYCDEIFVYDDNSTDGTAEIARSHPVVREVVASTLLDPDRMRAEWYNRNLILQSAKRFDPEWVVYFDADEWPHNIDRRFLRNPDVTRIDCALYDVHLTPDEEEWVDPRPRRIPFFFRHPTTFSNPDQRIMGHLPIGTCVVSGVIKHWGKGWSVEQWERKCDYYAKEFGHPAYAPKWDARRGKAIKGDYLSDNGEPLVKWETVCR